MAVKMLFTLITTAHQTGCENLPGGRHPAADRVCDLSSKLDLESVGYWAEH